MSDVVEEETEKVEASKALDTMGMRNAMRMILSSCQLIVPCLHYDCDADSIPDLAPFCC
jgi:hypothetical protein